VAHQILTHDTMFSYRETPWHGLGVVIDRVITDYVEAMQIAGLDWKVELRSLATLHNFKNVQFEDLQAIFSNPLSTPEAILKATRNLFVQDEVDDRYAVYRTDKNIYLGSVGARFVPMDNVEAFRWFQPFMESGEAKFETAGSLFDGKRVYVLASLNRDPIEVSRLDLVNKYLLLSHAHDGSLSIRGQFTPVRVVCNNTLTMARMDGKNGMDGRNDETGFYFKHTKNAQKKLDDIRETVDLANQKFDRTGEQYKWLAKQPIRGGAAGVREYVRQAFDMKDEKDLSTREENRLNKVIELHDNQISFMQDLMQAAARQEDIVKEAQQIAGESILDAVLENLEGGTGHELNSGAEHLTHEAGHGKDEEKRASLKNRNNRFNSLNFGPNKLVNQRALKLAVDMANDQFQMTQTASA
jgi:phage/plasmid-like protein (TIGR03299 family)